MTDHKPPVGGLLREWRQRRRMSQLELATEAGLSMRHLSFLETGRSKPSRETLLRLCERLEVPLHERNVLLVAAGYAPVFPMPSRRTKLSAWKSLRLLDLFVGEVTLKSGDFRGLPCASLVSATEYCSGNSPKWHRKSAARSSCALLFAILATAPTCPATHSGITSSTSSSVHFTLLEGSPQFLFGYHEP